MDLGAAPGEAEAVGFDDVGRDGTPGTHAAVRSWIEQIQGHARLARGPITGPQHHLRPAAHGQAFGQIDIVQQAFRQELEDSAIEAVDVKAGLLVSARNEAARGDSADHDRGGTGPDGRIIGGVLSGRPDRRCFEPGRDIGACADEPFALALVVDLPGRTGGQESGRRHKRGQGADEHGVRL